MQAPWSHHFRGASSRVLLPNLFAIEVVACIIRAVCVTQEIVRPCFLPVFWDGAGVRFFIAKMQVGVNDFLRLL